MNTDKKFEHKGVAITLTANGTFIAKLNGTEISAPSLSGLKKKLDKAKPFEPFEAFIVYHDGGTRHHRVVGVRKDRGYNAYHWITADGYSLSTAYVSTKENLAIVKKIQALEEQKDRAEKEFNKKIGALTDTLVKAELPKPDES